jgi:hypothetical protein
MFQMLTGLVGGDACPIRLPVGMFVGFARLSNSDIHASSSQSTGKVQLFTRQTQ